MKIPPVVTIDFETKRALRRPDYPPKPTSVSIQKPGERKPKFYAWGHPTQNNCTFETAQKALKEAWYDARWDLLFHFSNFDVDVAATHMGVKMPKWDRIHDTAYLIFLNAPHETLYLKPLAEKLLNMPPEERDEVDEWLRANFKDREKGEKWLAYIAEAPGKLVGPYADGDVIRTKGFFQHLFPIVAERGMLPAYNRERELMPILLENERAGVRIDVDLLGADIKKYQLCLEFCDQWLRKRLRSKHLNIDSNEEFADALERCGLVDPGDWVYTKPSKNFPGGQRSVSKENLTPDMIRDRRVALIYGYRNKLTTCLKTFMLPWFNQAIVTPKHTIHTEWSQIKNADAGRGAATGRMSSSPNFQNVPNSLEGREGLKFDELKSIIPQLLPLPLMRKYFLPDGGQVWGKADYSQQELRILDYFADGELGYSRNPKLDVHTIVTNAVRDEGLFLDRPFKDLRNDMKRHVVFKKIYGGGVPAICAGLGCTQPVASKIITAMLKAVPGYEAVDREVKKEGRAGRPIVTWGGREYFVEPARYIPEYGRVTEMSYKLTNYLIQGSAADVTKEAIIRYHNHPKREARFLLSVHDELDISMPRGRAKQEMKILTDCMESIDIDPAMVAEPSQGPRWSELEEVK